MEPLNQIASWEDLLEEVISAGMSVMSSQGQEEDKEQSRGEHAPCRRSKQLGVPKSIKGPKKPGGVGEAGGDNDRGPEGPYREA